MAVLDGCILLGCLRLTHFSAHIKSHGWTLEQCAGAALDMDPHQFLKAGGYIQILEKGQCAFIPPAWLMVQVGEDLLPDERKSKACSADGAAILAPCHM